MSKTIMLTLVEANALLVNRMGELIPELAEIYDGVPYFETVLEDVFLGRPLNQDLMATDILMLEGLTEEQARNMSHEVSNTVVDLVTAYMPHLHGTNHGYHFKVHDNFDLEITLPAYTTNVPEDRHQNFQMEIVEEIREAVDGGGFVPETLRRLAGC